MKQVMLLDPADLESLRQGTPVSIPLAVGVSELTFGLPEGTARSKRGTPKGRMAAKAAEPRRENMRPKILELARAGKGNTEIVQALHLPPGTVSSALHTFRVKGLLGAAKPAPQTHAQAKGLVIDVTCPKTKHTFTHAGAWGSHVRQCSACRTLRAKMKKGD